MDEVARKLPSLEDTEQHSIRVAGRAIETMSHEDLAAQVSELSKLVARLAIEVNRLQR